MSSSRISTRPSRNQPFATGGATQSTTTPELLQVHQPIIGTMTQRNAATSASASSAHHRVPHRVTVRKTAYQVGKLQEMWAQTHTPTKEQREQIAEEIGLETRIVSTWFRDERSKETRARAEKQRMERGTVGPVRNTRTSTAMLSTSSRKDGNTLLDAGSDEEEVVTTASAAQTQQAPMLDRHSSPSLQPQPPQSRASPRTRYAPYPVSHSIDLNATNVAKKLPSQRHFDPLIRASVPIDFHQPDHDSLAMETDAEESYDGYPSPNGYPRQSLAPSMSSSSSETSEDDEEDELEEEEDDAEHGLGLLRPHEFSPRTPALIPSTIPSPRVFQPSTSPNSLPPISTLGPSSPSNFVSSPLPKPAPSPYNLPITLPTQSGGTYTFKPLPVIVGPLPRRDSTWRFNYYDKVSNVRQTLGNKLHHDGSSSSSDLYRTPRHNAEHDDESDGDSASEDGIATSPAVRSSTVGRGGGILSGLGGLFGGGKKQLFASN